MPALEDDASVWEAYAQFLSTAPHQGIEAFALDGYPEAIHTREALLHKVRRLRAVLAGRRFAGLQRDIEPYLLEGFFVDDTGLVRYLTVLEQMREALGREARLSVVIPFWFTAQILHGRPVAFAVMDRADEVAVMSYRTEVDELYAITEDILRYGDLVGTPVWLALETRPLPIERHVVLTREPRRDLADAYVDQIGQRLMFQRPPATEELAWFPCTPSYHRPARASHLCRADALPGPCCRDHGVYQSGTSQSGWDAHPRSRRFLSPV
jgi:hypothetical protein